MGSPFWHKICKICEKIWLKIENLVKIDIFVKTKNFREKSKILSIINFWSEVEILVENRNFGQKSKFWSKIEILVKNRKCCQNFDSKKSDIGVVAPWTPSTLF